MNALALVLSLLSAAEDHTMEQGALQAEARRPLLLRRKDKRRLELERQILTFSGIDGVRTVTLGEKLGSGAQGEVFRGRMTSPALPVAVKVSEVLRAHPLCADPDTRKDGPAFEAFLLGKVIHDNVVKLIDHGPVVSGGPANSGKAYYAILMGLHDGGTLRALPAGPEHWLLRQGHRNGRSVMKDLVGAVRACHAARVLHSDIKPNNILLGEGGDVVLMDFGMGYDLTKGRADCPPLGTTSYLPPELFQTPKGAVLPWLSSYESKRFGFELDIWALGLTIFVVLARFNPFVVPRGAAHLVAKQAIPMDEENRAMEFLNQPLVETMGAAEAAKPVASMCHARVIALLSKQGFDTSQLSELCEGEKMLMRLIAKMLKIDKRARALPTDAELTALVEGDSGMPLQEVIKLATAKSTHQPTLSRRE